MACTKHNWESDSDCPYCDLPEGRHFSAAEERLLWKDKQHPVPGEHHYADVPGEHRYDHVPTPVCDPTKPVREFHSGATRSPLGDKLQYSGFISPIVLKRYAEYMHKHRVQENGELREADNWQKGIPDSSAFDSLLRHVMDVWLYQRGFELETSETLLDSLTAIIFNASVLILNQEKENANRA